MRLCKSKSSGGPNGGNPFTNETRALGAPPPRNGTGDSRKRLQALRDVVHHSRGETNELHSTEESKVKKKNDGPARERLVEV